MFDFINYTYSALMSLFAMVVGLAYPAILQAIQRIDDTYHDDFMIKRFMEENINKFFNVILVIALGVGFIVPFLLYLCDICGYVRLSLFLIIIQSIITFVLVASSIRLYLLIQTYYVTVDLLSHINNQEDLGAKLQQLVQIIMKTAQSANEDTYRQAYTNLCDLIVLYQSDFYQLEENKNKIIEYSDGYYGVLRELIKATTEQQKYHYLSQDNQITAAFYNHSQNVLVSQNTMRHFWISINHIVDSDCYKWFTQYWIAAEQYYRFALQFPDSDRLNDKSFIQCRDNFVFMHFMMGGFMIYKKKYDWLKFMLSFTQEMPYTYPLIPKTFQSIWNKLLEALRKADIPAGLARDYWFSGMVMDVRQDEEIFGYVHSYAALLIMRLANVQDFSVSDEEKYKLPDVSNKIKINERIIQRCDLLLKDVNELSENKELKQYIKYDTKKAEALLDEIKRNANHKNEELKKQNLPDTDRLEKLKGKLAEESQKFSDLYLPHVTEQQDGNVKEEFLRLRFKLKKEYFCEGYDSEASGIFEGLLKHINTQIQNWFLARFILTPPKERYQILYRDIFNALDRLNLDSSYSIINMGIFLGQCQDSFGKIEKVTFSTKGEIEKYGETPFFNVPSNTSQLSGIFILKSTDIPQAEYTDESHNDESKELKLLESSNGLYSNIENLTATNNVLIIGRGVKLVRFDSSYKFSYIRLSVNYDSSIGNLDLDKINQARL